MCRRQQERERTSQIWSDYKSAFISVKFKID